MGSILQENKQKRTRNEEKEESSAPNPGPVEKETLVFFSGCI